MIEINDILEVENLIQDADGVIFDLDDTLYSEKDYVKSGYAAIAKAYPNINNMFDRLWNAFLNKEPAIDKVFAEENMLSEKENALKIYRFHKPEISLYKNVREMLERIGEHKKIGIITDGRPEGQRAKIAALGLKADFIIITDELGGIEFRKPNPTAYKLMSEKMNIPYDRLVYIGDNIAKDFISPNRLGMKTIYFCNDDGLYRNQCERRVD